MPHELRPGELRSILRSVDKAGVDFAQRSTEELGQQTERQAKLNANTGAHRKGERTSARKGAGPNVVTGNLRRNITHTHAAKEARGWFVKVGVATAARYARFVEVNLDYPFLLPAAKQIAARARSIVKPLWRSPRG